MTYNIPNFPPGEVMMFLAMVARSYGRVLKGGVPDKVAAARTVLKDWNNGRIPFYTTPPADAGPAVGGDAVIVAQFGKEFDLSKFDDEVMKSLKDKDEMDFVQLEDGDKGIEMGDASREAIQYFNDGSDDEMEEDSGMEEDGKTSQRQIAASAEDYDFDDMC